VSEPIGGPPAQEANDMPTQPPHVGQHRSRTTSGARPRLVAGGRSLAAALAVAAIPVTMAATSLGSGSASAATVRPATAASKVAWHKLTMINGWATDASQYNSGNPSYVVRNGIVYLSGSMHQPSGNGTISEATILPPAARPAHIMYVDVYTYQDTVGHLIIFPDGSVLVGAATQQNAQSYTSLAGVSFPAKKTAAHALALIDGWHAGQAGYGKPGYSATGGMVYFSGALHQLSGSNDTAAHLPKADRPKTSQYLLTYTPDGTGIVRVDPNGAVSVYGSLATSFSSLAGVSFQVATSGRHVLTLANDWHAATFGKPSYSVVDGVVHLSGSLYESGTESNLFSVLPPAARPKHNMWIPVYTFDGAPGTLKVLPNGRIYLYSPTASTAREYSSLAGVTYPLGS
jgi:hypothetical protein